MLLDSCVHIFTSHFYTSLVKEGPKGVESLTSKKNLDIFDKKMIFIPINRNLHWSLCVVLNPYYIVRTKPLGSDRVPCILFLDSLKAHKKNAVAKNVHGWLNAEWKRLDQITYGNDNLLREEPFNEDTMEVVTPLVLYQDNSCDCGVFVCQYAYALFESRFNIFTWQDCQNNFHRVVTMNQLFKFNMVDIKRIREEFGILVDRLSELYAASKND